MASAQEDAFAIRTVLISVIDTQGARIEGLEKEDFELSERGIHRDVVDVVDEGVGAELYILVDTSIAFQSHTGPLSPAPLSCYTSSVISLITV